MKLAYSAYDKAGNAHADLIDAVDSTEARDKLRQRGLFVTRISEEDDADPRVEQAQTPRGGAFLKELALWSRQLSVLVGSGTPLAKAMIAIERQATSDKWRSLLADLRGKVEQGTPLATAMSHNPATFNGVVQNLIAAGESSGQLDVMLARVASITRQQLKIRRSLIGALVYPSLLIVVGIGVTTLMLVGVLPRFSGLFETLDVPLPPTTKILVALSEVIRSYWWVISLLIMGAAVGLFFTITSPGSKRTLDGFVIRLPYLGKIVQNLATAKIARLLGIMLESHIPLLEALQLTKQSTGNALYADLMANAEAAAVCGESISAVFAGSTLIAPSVSEAVSHGEQNGKIGPILSDMADFLDEENDVVVKTAMNLLEPAILVLMGIVVGFIAVSMFLPLFDLTAMAGG